MNVFESHYKFFFYIPTSINSLTKVSPLHNVTRGIFHNTWGGSQWPFHLEIPPGALNMTTNSGEPGLTLDLLPKFCSDTADTGWHLDLDFYIISVCFFVFFKKKQRIEVETRTLLCLFRLHLKLNVCRTWPPMFLWWLKGAAVSIFALGVDAHTVSAPAALACWCPFFLKLRFMQSSGTNECRVNLSRLQSGLEESTLGLSYLRFIFFLLQVLLLLFRLKEIMGHLVNVLVCANCFKFRVSEKRCFEEMKISTHLKYIRMSMQFSHNYIKN